MSNECRRHRQALFVACQPEKTFHRATEPLPGGSYRRKINRPHCGSGGHIAALTMTKLLLTDAAAQASRQALVADEHLSDINSGCTSMG
jgi:hypothetical protein